MKPTLTIPALLLFFSFGLNAQNYSNVWHFGDGIGIDFNSCTPEVIEGNNIGFEGCASICNEEGELLFYTNSDIVWNSEHDVMTNGTIGATSGSLSQVVIVPRPGNEGKYYIVTTVIQGSTTMNAMYHEIDMNLNNGLGEVIDSGNILTDVVTSEQIAATYHNNGTDIWLLTHEFNTDHFLAFLVTANGISTEPVISSVGPQQLAAMSNMNARGEIKFSPSGTMVAFNGNGDGVNDASNFLTLFDFNPATGVLTNPLDLPFSRGDFGLSFSPDNSKLYGTTWKAFNFTSNDINYLYQFDLSSGDPQTIIDSKVLIDSMAIPASYGTLSIGPDSKIYVVIYGASSLGVIGNPNAAGTACNYVENGLSLEGGIVKFGLNNGIEYKSYCTESGVKELSGVDQIIISPMPFSEYGIASFSFSLNNATAILYNSNGENVREWNHLSGQQLKIERDDLAAGMYFLQVKNGKENPESLRIIIQDK